MPLSSVNPATGEVLKTFDQLTDAQLEAKLARAATTYHEYRNVPFADRARMLTKAAEILEQRKEKYGRIMALEMGKTCKSAIAEAAKCATACRYYAENGEKFLADAEVQTGARRSFVRWQPLGAILAIMPWNFPFWQVIRFAAPALAAGNVGLLKHAPNVPQCALALEELFLEAGFSEGCFQSLFVEVDKVDLILDDPRVAAATLTGSERAGVSVGIAAAKRIRKVVLELGGSDPFIVMPSADLDKAIATAVEARCINNGQSCIAAKRFIVADSIYDNFERRFVERMKSLNVGDPFDEKTDVGPLVNADAVERLHAQVEKTIAMGARLLTGGHSLGRPGNFYPPTVLADIPEDSPAYREELFGPVASLFRARDIDDAIRIANDSRFGLGASAWTRDDRERDRFISEIEAGMVFINKMVASDARLPFGGIKHSGYGRELSELGIHEFMNAKTVCIES